MMGQQLPNNNRVYVFETLRTLIAGVIRDAIDTMVPGRTIAADNPLAKVYEYEQYPSDKKEREEVEMVNDPIVGGDALFTCFIELNFPGVNEDPYTSEQNTSLTFTFPIAFVMDVRKWATGDFPYPTSAQLFEAVYATCADKFRDSRDFGYDNVTHNYLQQVFADTDRDEDTGDPVTHVAQWMLTVVVRGARA